MSKNISSMNTSYIQDASNIMRKQELLRYVTDIGSSLRLQMDVKTLLAYVATATCEALGFRYAALYLLDTDGYFHAQATCGLSPEQEVYLCQHPLPNAIASLIIDERYRISNAYFIPSESALWENERFADHFIVVGEEPAIVPTQTVQASSSEWQTTDLIVVPLVSAENTLLGLLTPDEPLDGLRPDKDMMLCLELLANQAAIVIEGARLYEAARKSSEERAALIEIGRALFSPDALRDLHSVYETIYLQARRIMPIDSLFVARCTSDGDKLSFDYLVDEDKEYPIENYENVASWIRKFLVEEGKVFLFSTKEEYSTFADGENKQDQTDVFGTMRLSETLLFVPIHFGKEALGMLSVQSYMPHAYTQRQVEMLQEISIQAGIAITNARLYIEQREAVQRAQESEQLKNHFLMTASHELRTPLTAIQGYLELLTMHQAMLSEEDKTRFIINAHRASEEVILLLGNVMDTSHVNQKEIVLNLGATQLTHALAPVLDILEPALLRQQRRVELDIPSTFFVRADEARLRQVLLNVLNNALKYTPSGTNIHVGAEYLPAQQIISPLSASAKDVHTTRFAVLAIRDWGDGIALAEQERLFEKFVRLPNAVANTQRGSGLGLYLCRQLTEAMGGKIWVESTSVVGEGATFFIALPDAST